MRFDPHAVQPWLRFCDPAAIVGMVALVGRGVAGRLRRPIAWRLVLARAGVVLLGLLIPVLVLEAVLRTFGGIVPGEYQTAELETTSDAFGRANIANRAGWKRSSEFSTHVRVNSKGLRGPEIAYEKPPGTYRILVIGDSFTFGAQVEEDETFVAQLGDRVRAELARSGAGAPQVQTINGGVDGWNTYNELAWLQAEGLRYDPDHVVLLFYAGNDPGENYDWMKALRRSGVDVAPAPEGLLQRTRRALAGVSAVWSLVEYGVAAKLAPPPDPVDLDTSSLRTRRSPDLERKDRGWDLSVQLLRQVHQACADRHAHLTVVGIPTREYVLDQERPEPRLATIGQEAGVSFVDMLVPFRATSAATRAGLYFPKDRHWTPAGHELAAQVVAPTLMGDILTRMSRSSP